LKGISIISAVTVVELTCLLLGQFLDLLEFGLDFWGQFSYIFLDGFIEISILCGHYMDTKGLGGKVSPNQNRRNPLKNKNWERKA